MTRCLPSFLSSAVAAALFVVLPVIVQAEAVVHRVAPTTSSIVIDGVLDEPGWRSALTIELNFEVEPGENVPPPVRTLCFVTYDERNAYFGFRAFDPDPDRIRARFSDRDKAWSDDWVGIVLDTFNDQRRAYELFSTPLGVQIDAINDDVGSRYDESWNAIWDSAGRITEFGYEVEMAVPFNQIRFQRSEGEQTWGFDAIRSYPRGFRHHIGAFPRERGSNSYLSQTLKLVGMAGADPGRNLEIIPTLTGRRTDTRADLPDGDLEAGDPDGDLGVSVRWGITPNASLNGALNPDFSQVEADALQLDANETFALFYEETRPFFKEGADYFNSDLQLVHTRTIADPAAAGKLTGKQGRHTWGLFTARDDVTQVVVPGPEGSTAGTFATENLSSVSRYRYDFGSNSTVGATLTDRRGDGYANSVVSTDLVYRMSSEDMIRANVAWSTTRYNDEMAQAFGVPNRSRTDDGWSMEYLHGERGWWVDAYFEDFGEDYRSDLGFRPRVGYRLLRTSGAKVWWGDDDEFLQRTALGAAYQREEFQTGGLQEERLEGWFNFRGPRESYVSVSGWNGTRVFQDTEFDVWNATLYGEAQVTADLTLSFEGVAGDWIDFANVRPAERVFMRPTLQYRFGRHFSVHYAHIWTRLNVSGGTLFRISAPEVRLIQQFNTRTFVRLILQWTDVERRPDLYDEPVETKTETLLSQLLFTYKINPQTAFYAGYTENRLGTDAYDLIRTDRTLFLKLGYAWLR